MLVDRSGGSQTRSNRLLRARGRNRNSDVAGALKSSMGPRAIVFVVLVAALGVWAPSASASFPGHNGDLVVQTVNGLELVNPAAGVASPVCAAAVLCGHPTRPHFSANGQAIAFVDAATHRPVVVGSDGSCLWCLVGVPLTRLTGSESAFVRGGQSVTLARNGLWSVSLTGRKPRRLVGGPVRDAVWSVRGLVALVRDGWIWVGRPGHGKLRRLARGDSPSFSPDGARLAFARDGYVRIVAVGGRVQRRLVSGGAPAWSPDGRQIAYIGPGGGDRRRSRRTVPLGWRGLRIEPRLAAATCVREQVVHATEGLNASRVQR
jgi:hypothetical protein